jgi:ATPase subunit of ABC transporter with duplicated ATPase domains
MIRLIIICILLHFFVQSFVFKQRSVQVPHKLFSSPYGSVLLKCEGISKSYTGGITQFADISIDVAAGQRIGLIGINGCGLCF